MALVETKIANCRTASIRKTPWIPIFDQEVVGEKKRGESIMIDPDRTCYDWQDRKFYRTRNPKGWIHEGVIEYGGDESDG